MGWLRLLGSLELWVFLAKKPYKRDCILQKIHLILRSLLIVATPYMYICLLLISILYVYVYYTHTHTYAKP